MEYKNLEKENFKIFTHRSCEYFPCHPVTDSTHFNCLFCYCPLYALGKQCGGNFIYKGSIKDCSKCLIPHSEGGYDYVMKHFHKISQLANENGKQRDAESSSAVKRASIKIL